MTDRASPQGEAERMLVAAEELIKLRNMPGWQLLMAQFRTERDDAMNELCTVDPFDHKKIMRLQNVVERYDWMETTLDELIRQGVETEILDEESESQHSES